MFHVISTLRAEIITERLFDGITKARLGGFQCGLEFAPMFRSDRGFCFTRLIQLDQLSPERRQSRTATAGSTHRGFDHGNRKELFR
jgi:hypothetical protein